MNVKSSALSIREQLEKTNYTPRFSDEDYEALVLAALQMPLRQAQLSVQGLEKFTLSDLHCAFKKYLESPLNIKINPNSSVIPQNEDSFSDEEDFWLLTFLRLYAEPNVQLFIKEFGCYIKPHRSFLSISKRMHEIGEMSEAERDKIIDKVAQDIVSEESFSLSIGPTQKTTPGKLYSFYPLRCKYKPEKNKKPSPHIDGEIDKIMETADMIAQFSSIGAMEENDLAIIRGENVQYSMNCQAIIIGKPTLFAEVDVDLSTEGDKSCIHKSKKQAIIYFHPDCNFYIENVGNRVFRVNGVPIHPDQVAKIPSFAILDFSDTLFMFIPNKKLINELSQIVEKD